MVIDTEAGKTALALGMGARWRADLLGDGVSAERVEELVASSHTKITTAPALVLACLTWDGLDRYPDEARQRAEWGMALLSLGAAVENLMLSAATPVSRRAGSRRRSSARKPRDALELPTEWLPHALVLVGHPDPSYVPAARDHRFHSDTA